MTGGQAGRSVRPLSYETHVLDAAPRHFVSRSEGQRTPLSLRGFTTGDELGDRGESVSLIASGPRAPRAQSSQSSQPPPTHVGRRRASDRCGLVVTFEEREQQPLPSSLPRPPTSWGEPYRHLASEVEVEPDLGKAFALAAEFLDPILGGHDSRRLLATV
jgi:hypothetical protein